MSGLSDKTIEIVKATAPVVAEHAEEITKTFYPILFTDYPETKEFFNHSHQAAGTQQKALASAVVAYASNIDNLGALGAAVEGITERHVSLNILPEHYPMVGHSLLKAIAEVLGDAATPEIAEAWGEAYFFLADLLISVEKKKYQETLAKIGGWNGYKEFVLDQKISETTDVYSFYFKPVDGSPIIDYKAGQYISIRLDLPDLGTSVRNYTLSSSPGEDALRLTVKKDGVFSKYLHENVVIGDKVELNPPFGQFTLSASSNPIVFITGGVGITPAVSMLGDLTRSKSSNEILFVYGTQSKAAYPCRDQVFGYKNKLGSCSLATFYSEIFTAGVVGETTFEGKIDLGKIDGDLPEDADYYVCGPGPMMKAVVKQLLAKGVSTERIHYEYFGPSEDILNT
ncbi:MAG: NO-inducible flavohemoprotein [Lentisphaeria bacterium]|nr:NO-inducible flavohemoprotein [Lentisphaeria bacterium]